MSVSKLGPSGWSRLVDTVATLLWIGYETFVAFGTCDEVAFPSSTARLMRVLRIINVYIYIHICIYMVV